MEHVRFSGLKRSIGVLDGDGSTLSSPQPEHDALETAVASVAQVGECGVNQSIWTNHQHFSRFPLAKHPISG